MKAERPITCLITSGKLTQENFAGEANRFIERLSEAAADGVDVIQIREKALSARNLSEIATRLVEKIKNRPTRILLNDRADIAAASGCDGVHLTTHSLSIAVARQVVGENSLISTSTHTLEEAQQAGKAGADIILFGPVFATPGKGEPVGAEMLAAAARAAGRSKLLALGGVDELNFQDVLKAGSAGFAAIRSLNDVQRRRAILNAL